MKYFGIGLPRTGTTSIAYAFDILGFRSKHYFEGREFKKIHLYDFASDHPISERFEELDNRFEAKFIYTVRDKADWLISLEKHMNHKKRLSRRMRHNRMEIFGTIYYDESAMSYKHDKHYQRVIEYFKDRDNLLIMNICKGEGWNKLIPFIDSIDYIPSVPFPYRNRRK